MFLNYEKRKNAKLFENMQSHEQLQISKIQNFIPIYKRFFSLNNSNFNSINLNHSWHILKVFNKKYDNENEFMCEIKNSSNDDKIKQKIFIKMAALLEPYKYLVGKYDCNDSNLFNLPNLESNTIIVQDKINDINNSSYVDGFFCYLSSKLLNKHQIINCIDFYGSFLALKRNYKINIIDDIEHLIDSDFFNKNQNKLFYVEDYSHLVYKPSLEPINITDETAIIETDNINFDDYLALSNLNNAISKNNLTEENLLIENNLTEENLLTNKNLNLHNTLNLHNSSKSSNNDSFCSSRTSHSNSNVNNVDDVDNTNQDKEIEQVHTLNEINSKTESLSSYQSSMLYSASSSLKSSSIEEEKLFVTFNEFPIQLICLECCEGTFDELIYNSEMTHDEIFSALMQIIMTLLVYQKAFHLTHNDLHTNNIMFIKTKIRFIYYIYNNKTYKVPTFGKIYKIIDFGRAIYKFNGQLICSDSFKSGNDAATQYNIEPYFNNKKPKIEPNFSFDICRLACSLFDYFVDDISEVKDLSKCDPLVRLIAEWCLDDSGVNILYKNNGSERYPDFKLYKMIARLVHIHTPDAQLERDEFKKYLIDTNLKSSKCKNNKKVEQEFVVNIDTLPCYAN